MGEIAINIAKWALKISFFSALAIAFSILLGVMTSYLVVGFNTSILSDIFAVIQIWLPFNLNILLIWMSLAATTYLTFRLSLMIFNLIDQYLGGK